MDGCSGVMNQFETVGDPWGFELTHTTDNTGNTAG
jgi:hypothetical protein